MSRILALSLAALALVSCGSGTAALVSGSGGGSGNAATSVSGLTVLDAKTAPRLEKNGVVRRGDD